MGPSGAGALVLTYGSKNIPVHLNPKFSDVKSIPSENDADISVSPNPMSKSWSVATIVWPESEDGAYEIFDMLGRIVQQGPIRLFGGAEQQRIYFSNLAQGTYLFTIKSARHSASAKIVKLSTASNGSSSQPSIIQQMKQARDDGTILSTQASGLPR
jgi:hypothetical protein